MNKHVFMPYNPSNIMVEFTVPKDRIIRSAANRVIEKVTEKVIEKVTENEQDILLLFLEDELIGKIQKNQRLILWHIYQYICHNIFLW